MVILLLPVSHAEVKSINGKCAFAQMKSSKRFV